MLTPQHYEAAREIDEHCCSPYCAQMVKKRY